MRAEDLHIDTLLAADAEVGALHFAGHRAVIVDAAALGALRRELMATLGPAEARAMLTRFGHVQGWRAAEALRGRFEWDSEHAIRDAGGRVGILQGMLRLMPGTGPMTPEGATVGDSYEAEQHLLHCGKAEAPVCWTLAGFASGYLSCVEQREIVVVEDRCVACGDATCRFLARPREAWGEPAPSRDPALAEEAWETRSPAMRRVLELARRAAAVDSNVLLGGASGTGKDRLARFIHARSSRAQAPFLALHCGAIPEPLLESELFGHARGAFTGATRDRVGMLEAAGRGTLFLDEVGEMSPAMQVKLLRALQQRELRRVGENHARPIHARVIAATHRDLAAAVEEGSFRRDLYYRLRVIELRLPSLAERREDILPLARTLLAAACAKVGRNKMSLGAGAEERLLGHAWPGNVRELENAMERAAALGAGPTVEASDLPDDIGSRPRASGGSLQQLERAAIAAALERHGGHQQRAAAELGISPSTLYRRLRRGG
ncbi:V4R domain-containing protein [Nannocystis exedens]|uniref:V4R domain-containing protein n=1 Tax=Nannocystis exedens TaxID=54 RepID=A0A1I2F0J4_9BACT|nr:sigma 54-interacting transcriptional regulator [Nannocystis exedens]PCC69571.1 sigma-54-dependent Fis family transcriptional regulator [Nannocystis exedens]SFE98529.1 V4R domain-containing protein [Nannocystis exedens]